jgi:hypothetical protein
MTQLLLVHRLIQMLLEDLKFLEVRFDQLFLEVRFDPQNLVLHLNLKRLEYLWFLVSLVAQLFLIYPVNPFVQLLLVYLLVPLVRRDQLPLEALLIQLLQ